MQDTNLGTVPGHDTAEIIRNLSGLASNPYLAQWSAEHMLGRALTGDEVGRLRHSLRLVRDAEDPVSVAFARHSLSRTVRHLCVRAAA